MTAGYTCPRCVQLVHYSVPHDCTSSGGEAVTGNPRGGDGPMSKPAHPLSTRVPCVRQVIRLRFRNGVLERWVPRTVDTLAPGGLHEPAGRASTHRTEGASTPEAGAEICPYCDGRGWYVGHEAECYEGNSCGCSGVQIQCSCDDGLLKGAPESIA